MQHTTKNGCCYSGFHLVAVSVLIFLLPSHRKNKARCCDNSNLSMYPHTHLWSFGLSNDRQEIVGRKTKPPYSPANALVSQFSIFINISVNFLGQDYYILLSTALSHLCLNILQLLASDRKLHQPKGQTISVIFSHSAFPIYDRFPFTLDRLHSWFCHRVMEPMENIPLLLL